MTFPTGRDEDNSQPWWVGSIYKIGIPSAICLFLIWFIVVQVRDKLEAVDNKLNQHIQSTSFVTIQNEKILKVLQQICINSSATNQERNECF